MKIHRSPLSLFENVFICWFVFSSIILNDGMQIPYNCDSFKMQRKSKQALYYVYVSIYFNFLFHCPITLGFLVTYTTIFCSKSQLNTLKLKGFIFDLIFNLIFISWAQCKCVEENRKNQNVYHFCISVLSLIHNMYISDSLKKNEHGFGYNICSICQRKKGKDRIIKKTIDEFEYHKNSVPKYIEYSIWIYTVVDVCDFRLKKICFCVRVRNDKTKKLLLKTSTEFIKYFVMVQNKRLENSLAYLRNYHKVANIIDINICW